MAIGFDVGTYNLVCCRRDDKGDFLNKREINAFIELPLENRFVFEMMKNAGVPLIERDNVAYALGEAAVNMAYTISQLELKRPMSGGCVNPKEKDAFQILNIMIHSLLDGVKHDNETLYYCVPANAINEETDADYHQKVLEAIFKAYESENGYKVNAHPINEALALVYAELGKKAYTGIGVSCLCLGTKIYTKEGIKKIEDVKINDLVLTHKGRWRPITNIITKNFEGLQTKLQISGYSNTTDDYKFVDNHEVYVCRNESWQWIGCEELVEGDIVGEPIEQQNTDRKTLAMTICERNTNSKQYTKKRIEISGDVWRIIGYFLADGSLNRHENCLNFDFKKDETDNIKDVQEILFKNFNKESSLTVHGDNCTRIKAYSKGLVSYFEKFYNESKEKQLPWNLSRLSKGDCINLLSGLIRGDGSISDNSISFENTSSSLAILVKQLFSRLGIPASISYRDPRSHEFEDRIIEGKKIVWKVDSGSKTTMQSLSQIISEICCDNSIHSEKLFIHQGMCCGKIQKIEHDEYKGIVYDLQVEEDHSFSGPQLTIHNCGAGMVNICYAMYGNPLFKFAIVNSGDWIDKQAAKATGESPTFINQEKTKVDLSAIPKTMVERAIQTQYRIMIEHTIAEIKKGLSTSNKAIHSDTPVDIIIAGGTSSPPGFDKMFRDTIMQAKLPIKIGDVIRPSDPLFSVARGCLIAAEAAK
jgi:intein/homing endonuclease/actin-like ATPase involved in cell morphogenesis